MEYLFHLGSFPYISAAEILNVLDSEQIPYQVLSFDEKQLHIDIDNIHPEVFLEILGGTRAITTVATEQTIEQDIKGYKKREFHKPRVDAKVGLLPSKLAKMMINLSFTKEGVKVLYDPFCGGGTIVTEANVMGIKGIGSDASAMMIKDAKQNAKWMSKEYNLPPNLFEFFIQDVRYLDIDTLKTKQIEAVVTEPYLGNAVNKVLKMNKNEEANLNRVNMLIEECLKKASAILPLGHRVVIIIPCYRSVKGLHKLDISEKYKKYSFKKINPLEALHIDKNQNLLYFRPKAVVLRELFILEKI